MLWPTDQARWMMKASLSPPIDGTDQLSDEADYQEVLSMHEGFDDGLRPRLAIGATESRPAGGAGVVPCSCGRADTRCVCKSAAGEAYEDQQGKAGGMQGEQ